MTYPGASIEEDYEDKQRPRQAKLRRFTMTRQLVISEYLRYVLLSENKIKLLSIVSFIYNNMTTSMAWDTQLLNQQEVTSYTTRR
jgi:hypothetical protein